MRGYCRFPLENQTITIRRAEVSTSGSPNIWILLRVLASLQIDSVYLDHVQIPATVRHNRGLLHPPMFHRYDPSTGPGTVGVFFHIEVSVPIVHP